VFEHLDIYDPRERWLVGLADAALTATAWPLTWVRPPAPGTEPRRILLLRLERIGDFLMSLGAIRAVRAHAPDAVIDLVVGSWNAELAQLVPGIDRVEVLDTPWLARGGARVSRTRMWLRTQCWRSQHYDLAINLEGDIRSHLLMAASLARRRVGFPMAGGGSVLTDPVGHDPRRHTAMNALALVERAFDLEPGSLPGPLEPKGRSLWRLDLPASARTAAQEALVNAGVPRGSTQHLVAVHVPGGRAIKQWPVERFADTAARLARETGARLIFTGTAADSARVAEAVAFLPTGTPAHSVAADLPLPVVGAILERSRLVVTGDTGPMHLAAAVGTPVVGVFGPSDPARYAPLSASARVVRVDLPCSPCNRIRLPPSRCVGHTPDCLEHVSTDRVTAAALELWSVKHSAAGRS
jgi:ADP-heptose:LPS heptosyltransferase